MKTRQFLFTAVAILVLAVTSRAQFAFEIEQYCVPEKETEKVTLPAATFAEIVRGAGIGIPDKDACLLPSPAGTLNGYKADYDGDGSEELCFLYHNGPADAGCNVVVFLAPMPDGKFKFLDMLPIPGGNALIRPINVLETGTQMYVQDQYPLADGNPETKGTILSLKEGSCIILISWTQKPYTREGKRFVDLFKVAFFDQNFDGRKELFLLHRTHETAGALKEKNVVDEYVLTYDFVPAQLRYVRYDSSGYDKVKEAASMTKAGERMLWRDISSGDGIMKMREGLRVNPFLSSARVRLGEFLLHAGKYGDAEKALLEATAFEPGYAKSYKLLGDTYLRLNDLQKSLAAYNKYLELNPNAKDKKKIQHNIRQITIPKARVR